MNQQTPPGQISPISNRDQTPSPLFATPIKEWNSVAMAAEAIEREKDRAPESEPEEVKGIRPQEPSPRMSLFPKQ